MVNIFTIHKVITGIEIAWRKAYIDSGLERTKNLDEKESLLATAERTLSRNVAQINPP